MQGSENYLKALFCDNTKSISELTNEESLGQLRLGMKSNQHQKSILTSVHSHNFKLVNGMPGKIGPRAPLVVAQALEVDQEIILLDHHYLEMGRRQQVVNVRPPLVI